MLLILHRLSMKEKERKKRTFTVARDLSRPGEQYRETRRSFRAYVLSSELFFLLSFEKTNLIITQTSTD